MKLLMLFFLLMIVGCVGTVQDTAQPYAGVSASPKENLTFPGVHSAVAISDSRIEVFFYPATGGSGKFTYDVIVGSSPIPVSFPADVLQTDYRGILKVTLTGLTRVTTYLVKVEARDNELGTSSNSQKIVSATTFPNQVADFQGISSAHNLPGQDGKDSLKLRWTPARTSGNLTKQEWDPKRYEVVLVDTSKLTPGDLDVEYTNAQGKWVYTFNHDDSINEYIVRGLPSKTKFYIRMRAIHEASIDDVYVPSKRSELNTNYVTIATLSPDLADINFQPESFAVTLANGESGLNAVFGTWTAAQGIFDHYRLYYALEGGGVASGSLPDLCLSELLSPIGSTVFCKKVGFESDSSPITGLKPYSKYEVVLVLCATSACESYQRILSPVRYIETDPSFPSFSGITQLVSARYLEELGSLTIAFDAPSFTNGYFDGLILKLRRTTDGSDVPVELTTLTSPEYYENYNFLVNNSITIHGINYLASAPYCFTLYPYKWDSDGLMRREMPNDIWKCMQPTPEAPTNLEFLGLMSGTAEKDIVTLNWSKPSKGIFSHYELFWRKQSSMPFNWGDAIAQAGNFDHTNYERILIDSEASSHTLAGFADGSYIFGMLTYFSYVSDDGTVIMRSETNSALKTCIINSLSDEPILCN